MKLSLIKIEIHWRCLANTAVSKPNSNISLVYLVLLLFKLNSKFYSTGFSSRLKEKKMNESFNVHVLFYCIFFVDAFWFCYFFRPCCVLTNFIPGPKHTSENCQTGFSVLDDVNKRNLSPLRAHRPRKKIKINALMAMKFYRSNAFRS